jgi:hypothetical protein
VRYYVVCKSEVDGVAPHIVAEVVRDSADDDRDATLAAALTGERRVIATREELLDHPFGREALQSWEVKDDDAYDDECDALRAAVVRPLRGLRLVRTSPAD